MKKASNKLIYSFFAILLIGYCDGISPIYGQSSVLQSGRWYKVAIEKNGVYKIDQSLFKKMGFPANTDPRKIKIYGNEGGMLPQANSMSRPMDLVENSIQVQGEGDGTFNTSDYILFYAQGADKNYLDVQKEIFFYQRNLYADKNYYFITVGETNGKRITMASDPGGGAIVNEFENFVYYELDQYSELKSGRDWYGERFDLNTEFTKSFNLEKIVSGSEIKLVSDVMAKSFTGSSFKIFLNDVEVGQQAIATIPNTQYGIKGRDKRDTLVFNANTVLAPSTSNQEIKYQYIKNPTGIGFLDYFLLQVKQKLALYGQQTIFRSLASVENPVSKYELEQTTAQAIIWDISNPYEPVLQGTVFSSGTTSFSAVSGSVKEFIAFSSASAPELAGPVTNQNIHGLSVPSFVIVTHPDFKTEAFRLAVHRNEVDGIPTAVVTTSEVYNEFSSGRHDLTAIRDFAKFLNDKSPGTLKSLLLFGKASYDYKKRVVDNINLVPTYESRNSLHPLLTYASDDYFTFLENNEGEWGEEPAISHTMDISVGRIPVKNNTEAKNVVDKIIRYDTDASLLGKWRKEIVFVADDGSNSDGFTSLHQSQANSLAQYVESSSSSFDTKKIFIGTYQKKVSPAGETIPEANADIKDFFNKGALIINYTGHGGERQWADEKIFDDLAIVNLNNKILPFLVTATCEFGRQDDPIFISGAELCVLNKEGGAIGMVTTSRPVYSTTNFELNQAFYEALLQQENNHYLSIGEISRRTKNSSISGVSNRNFSLIGDPSMTLKMPTRKIKITEIKTADGSTVLKGLSTVTVKGEVPILGETTIDTNFNGVLTATLYDKETSFVTIGQNNPAYNFKQWFNALFRGKASVREGIFEFQFIVPKNIAYQIDEGKLSLYAYDSLNNTEASGYSQDFEIGSSEPEPEPDSTPPTLTLFMGDTTFVNGGITNPNTTLVARLYDLSGINISGYGIGNSILGVLDESQTFVLNDFYEADIDDFTNGTISFPLKDVTPGKHTISVKAWDTHNNPIQATIAFVVTDGTNLAIESFGNYPNPFETSTTLFFTHNRSGDDLQVSLVLYDYTGHIVESYAVNILASSYHVDLLKLNRDSGKNRPSGLYFARIVVRSITNGSKNEQVTKLIISN